MKPGIYLAGPITGLSYDDARNGWRREIAEMIGPDIDCYSPMRAKEFLAKETVLRGDPNMYDDVIATASGILTRDFNDVKQCDAMIANFLGAEKVSIGTCCEFGFAYALRKPVILVMENDIHQGSSHWHNVHDHAFIDEIAGYRVDNLEDAAFIARSLLLPGV